MKKIVLCFVVVLSLITNSVIPVLARTFTDEEVIDFTKEDIAELTLEDLENMPIWQLQEIFSSEFINDDTINLSEKFPDFYKSLLPEFGEEFWFYFNPKGFNEALGRGNARNGPFSIYYNDIITFSEAMQIGEVFYVEPYDFFSGLGIRYEYDEDTQILEVPGKFTHTAGAPYVTLENGSRLEGGYSSLFYLSPRGEESWYIALHLPLIIKALGLRVKYHAPSTSILLYSPNYEIPEERQFVSD
jgi:hypothetical protein